MATHPGESYDERLALNLRAVRDGRGLSQAALADAMSARGHGWHQQTVARAEAGTQPVKFAEAASLAEILGVPLDRFTWTSPEAAAARFLAESRDRVVAAAGAVTGAAAALLRARHDAGVAVGSTREHATPAVAEAREELLAALAGHDLAAAVAAGVVLHEHG